MTFNMVNVQAESLDYLGSIIDGSVLTNDNEALGTYKSIARACLKIKNCTKHMFLCPFS